MVIKDFHLQIVEEVPGREVGLESVGRMIEEQDNLVLLGDMRVTAGVDLTRGRNLHVTLLELGMQASHHAAQMDVSGAVILHILVTLVLDILSTIGANVPIVVFTTRRSTVDLSKERSTSLHHGHLGLPADRDLGVEGHLRGNENRALMGEDNPLVILKEKAIVETTM